MTDNDKYLPYTEGTADDLRKMIGRHAWAAEKSFGKLNDRVMADVHDGKALPDGLAEAHRVAHWATAYAWTTVSLLGFIRDAQGEAAMHEAACMVDDMLTNGDAPHAEDITDETKEVAA